MQISTGKQVIELAQGWGEVACEVGMGNFTFAEDNFSQVLTSEGGARRFSPRESGVYMWQAEDGECYVGQALDVQSRLRQHFRNHRDIVSAAFMQLPADRLDQEERRVVAETEPHFTMRNVKLVRSTGAHRPLDDFLNAAEQNRFSALGNDDLWLLEARRSFPFAEARQRAKLRKLDTDPEFAEFVKAAVSEFVMAMIPRPAATENRFWSVSLFPESQLVARINAGQQEVLTLHVDNRGIAARVICPTTLSKNYDGPFYQTSAYASWLELEQLADLLENTQRGAPVREHVLWLMRHTTPLNLRSHCPGMFVPEMTDRRARLVSRSSGEGF